MPEVEIRFTDGASKNIEIPKLLGYKTGRKIRRAIKVSVTSEKGKGTKATFDDAMSVLDQALEIVYEDVVKKHLSEDEQDKVAFESVEKVAEFYWNQIEGAIKKKDRNAPASTSS